MNLEGLPKEVEAVVECRCGGGGGGGDLTLRTGLEEGMRW